MIVVVGESLIDIVEDKASVGGGPLNIAVGLARLDQDSLLISQSGSDDHADKISAYLHDNEVEAVMAPTSTGHTNTATASLDHEGVATYDFELEWTLPAQELPRCDVLHVGSLGTVLEPGRTSVLDLIDQAWGRDVFVSYDPNLRPQFMRDRGQTWRDVESIANHAGLIKMSSEDVELIHPGADTSDIARSLLNGERTELVIVTDGAEGSAAYTKDLAVRVESPQIDLVDTVGAGDSFMSAILAILSERDAFSAYGPGIPDTEAGLEQLLRGAATAAGVTCSRRGANPPTLADLPAGWPD